MKRIEMDTARPYYVNEDGEVFSEAYGRVRKIRSHFASRGRPYVSIQYADGKRVNRGVARLVYEAFVGGVKPTDRFSAKNGNHHDCRLSNIVVRQCLGRSRSGERGARKCDAEDIKRLYEDGCSVYNIAHRMGATEESVRVALKRAVRRGVVQPMGEDDRIQSNRGVYRVIR